MNNTLIPPQIPIQEYNCEHCGKSYLSKPALNNHMNTKHAEILKQLNIEKRKRGRPRKYVNIYILIFFFV